MAQSPAQRQKTYIEKMLQLGFKQHQFWVTDIALEIIKKYQKDRNADNQYEILDEILTTFATAMEQFEKLKSIEDQSTRMTKAFRNYKANPTADNHKEWSIELNKLVLLQDPTPIVFKPKEPVVTKIPVKPEGRRIIKEPPNDQSLLNLISDWMKSTKIFAITHKG